MDCHLEYLTMDVDLQTSLRSRLRIEDFVSGCTRLSSIHVLGLFKQTIVTMYRNLNPKPLSWLSKLVNLSNPNSRVLDVADGLVL